MKLSSVMLVASLIAGCTEPRFQVSNAGGHVYRLDGRSGALSTVVGGKLVNVTTSNDGPPDSLAKAKTWPSDKLPNGITTSIKTKWRDGKIYYSFMASPFEGPLQQVMASYNPTKQFTLEAYDEDQFVVASIPVLLNAMVKVVKPSSADSFQSAQFVANQEMSAETYRQIAGWSVIWNF